MHERSLTRLPVILAARFTAWLSHAQELKVDINNSGRQWTEGTDPAFAP